MICPICEQEIKDNSKFCGKCGKMITYDSKWGKVKYFVFVLLILSVIVIFVISLEPRKKSEEDFLISDQQNIDVFLDDSEKNYEEKDMEIYEDAEIVLNPLEKIASHITINDSIFNIKIVGIELKSENIDQIGKALESVSAEDLNGTFPNIKNYYGNGWNTSVFVGTENKLIGRGIVFHVQECREEFIPDIAGIKKTDTARETLKKIGFMTDEIEKLTDINTIQLNYINGKWEIFAWCDNNSNFRISINQNKSTEWKSLEFIFGEDENDTKDVMDMQLYRLYCNMWYN